MLQSSRFRTLPRIGIAFGAALTLMAATGAPAHAAGSTLVGEGLHVSTGALVDPNGRTWVSDHNGGFCRMTPAGDDGPGHIEHPQVPGQRGIRTCLGGLLPDAGPGPDAAGQPVLVDPDTSIAGDEMALIPDGASPSSEVIRAEWNEFSGLFEYKDTITMSGARGRPTSLSVGPDDAVYVGFQRETTIQRISDPASDFPVVEVVGTTSDDKGAQSVAAGRDADGNTLVYVNQASGLSELRPGTRSTQPSPSTLAVPAGTAISALYYDLRADKLYVGTANEAGEGADTVLRFDPLNSRAAELHADRLSMVGGIGQAPAGNLFVLDDPALLDPAEPLGTGRLFHVGLPAAHVVAGPLDDAGNAGRDRSTRDTTPTFTLQGDGTLECRLSGPGQSGSWTACDTTYTTAEALGNHEYTLSVRATNAGKTGLPEAYRFTVDTIAPLKPVVASPREGTTVGPAPWFDIRTEDNAELTCVVDGGEAQACRPGRIPGFATAGEHTIQVTATDPAGNVSPASALVRFNVDLSVEPVSAPGWGAGPPAYTGSSLYTTGLHISTGALVDPDGRTWVADHNGGFCRVIDPDENGPGRIDHPSFPGETGVARTCLGGLLPEAGTGPDAAGQPALFDPSPSKPGNGDEMALIPDGASPSSEVVRAQWNPDTGLFEYKDTVSMIGARIRPTAVAAAPDGTAYVIFQKSGTVQRIGSPAGAQPTVDIVGNTLSGRSSAIAATSETVDGQRHIVVYVGEDTVLTRLEPNAVSRPNAVDTRVDLGGASIGAMIADSARGHLYIGTANATTAGADSVARMVTATNAVDLDWRTGYSMVGGFGLRPDGVLFVLDDPALLDPVEPIGTGRMFHIGLPAAHIVGAGAFVAEAQPVFTIATDAEVRGTDAVALQVQCRLRGGPANLDTEWVDCAEDGTFKPQADLADGEYRLAVRALENTDAGPVAGLVEAHSFTIDTVDPGKPRITSPANGAVVSATPWFAFEGDEGVTFLCAWDGAGTWTACEPGRTRTFLENAPHELTIRAVDEAGNVSESSDPVKFTARGKIESVRIDSGPEGSSQNPTARFEFSSNAVDVQYSCRIDHAAFSACVSGKTYTLPDGTYTFEVRGRDSVGNVSPAARREFTIDRTKPQISANGFTNGALTGPDVTFDIATSEAATLSCTLNDVVLAPCGSPIALTGLTEGVQTLRVVATDAAGNQSAELVRRFTVQGGFQAPAPAPAEPSVTVIDQTGSQLKIRIADIDRRVDLTKLREAGVTVQVIPAQGTKLIRFRIFKLSGNGRNRGGRAVAAAAGTRRTVVATVYRKVSPGRKTIRLTRRELRKVGTGRYLLEVTPGTSRRSLGTAQTAQFRVS